MRTLAAALTLLVVVAVSVLAAEPNCPPTTPLPTRDDLEAARLNARDRGALWRIEKDGRQSWLYGTIHLGRLETSIPGRKVSEALAATDMIAVELDVTDPATLKTIAAPQDPRDAPAVPAALLERLKALVRKACLPWEPFATMPPLLVATSLGLLDARWDGHDPSYGSDLLLIGIARAMGKPVRSLESVEVQRRALFGGTPDEQLKVLDGLVTALEQNRVRPVVKTLAAAWSGGDLATIAGYEQWCECVATPAEKAQLDRMVSSRNPDLAAAVDALHRDGHRVFAATGILHMVGDRALPKLIEGLGYTVERVRFDVK